MPTLRSVVLHLSQRKLGYPVRLAQLIYLAFMLAAGAASSAAAQGEVVTYEVAVERALQAHAAKDYVAARAYMEHAHALQPSARTLRGLGTVAHGQGDFVTAVVRLEAALSEQQKPLPDELRASVQVLLDEAYLRVGRYTLEGPSVDASVLVDGAAPVRDASGRLLLAQGTHVLRVSFPQGEAQQSVVTQGGELTSLSLAPPAAPPEAARQPAPQPLPTPSLPPTPVVRKEERPDSSGPKPLPARPIVLVAVGGSSVLMAVTFSALAHARYNDLVSSCRRELQGGCTDDQKKERVQGASLHNLTNAARILAVGGSVVFAAGAIELLVRTRRRARASLSLSSQAAAIDVSLRF